jgi:hypothetical protein
MRRLIPVFAATAALAGCASSERAPSTRPTVAPRPTVPTVPRPRPAPGELVIGRTAAALTGLFGAPALDVPEGSARKLQFAGETCVLDAYLYPPEGRGEPVVTHVDARLPDGRDTDRAACAEALRRR